MKPEHLSFPPGHLALGLPLGEYYQNFDAALTLVDAGFHGPLNPGGVPMARGVDGAANAFPILVAQYALALIPGARRGDPEALRKLRTQVDWLLERQTMSGPKTGFWVMDFNNAKYPSLRAPWVSALAQGNGVSALLRAGEVVGPEERLTEAALAAYRAMHVPVQEDGVLDTRASGPWLEEYPTRPPRGVLNGAIYSLLGVLDVARITGDSEAWEFWEEGVRTIADLLPRFDTGFWSTYELAAPALSSVHYHKNIHIPLLRILGSLSGRAVFDDTAGRWTRYLHSPWCKLRHRLERRRRWRQTVATISGRE